MKQEIKKVLSLSLWGLYGMIALSFIVMGTSCGISSGPGNGEEGDNFNDNDDYGCYDCEQDKQNQ